MKILTLVVLIFTMSVFAAPKVNLETKCFQIQDSLDRDYCQKKKASLIEGQYSREEKTWANGLQKVAKDSKAKTIQMKINQKEEELNFAKKELEILKAHQAKLAKVKVVTPKKKKKKKKKKSDLEKLGIKL